MSLSHKNYHLSLQFGEIEYFFVKVNCKQGENRCGCVDKTNVWIETYNDADNLKDEFNCQCARDKLADNNIGLKCDKRGNYQPIQTFKNEYCVDEDGKHLSIMTGGRGI